VDVKNIWHVSRAYTRVCLFGVLRTRLCSGFSACVCVKCRPMDSLSRTATSAVCRSLSRIETHTRSIVLCTLLVGILVLDDLEHFVVGHQRQTLLYALLNAAYHRNAVLCIVGISSTTNVPELLEKRVRSRFSQKQLVVLQPPSLLEVGPLLPVGSSQIFRTFTALCHEPRLCSCRYAVLSSSSPLLLASFCFLCPCCVFERC
jgi:hypothetical protein